MNDHPTALRCPACNTPLHINLHLPGTSPTPLPHPPSTHTPTPHTPAAGVARPHPPSPGIAHPHMPPPLPLPPLPASAPAAPAAARSFPPRAQQPAGRWPAAPRLPQAVPVPAPAKPRKPRRRLSPQATLLSLGVLLLLAAGVTFLAVTWDSLPVAIQAAIMATLAAIALAGAVPASKYKLTGTAEALAILGSGLLAVDLYGARELGLVPPTAIDGLTYAAVSCATVAAINLLMSRTAPKVVTFGVAAVIVG